MVATESSVRPARSLRRNSLARLCADLCGLLFGIAVGIITARLLGPAGKGLFSALLFLGGLFAQICVAGLGEAAMVRVGQGRITLQGAVAATSAAALVSSLVGAAAFFVLAAAMFGSEWSEARLPVLIATITLPLAVGQFLLGQLLTAQERIVAASTVILVTSGVTAASMWGLTSAASVTGATLAWAAGTVCGLGLALAFVRQERVNLWPHWAGAYIRSALRYGAVVQLAYLVQQMAARADLLLVYTIAGQRDAGYYSIVLTVAGVVGAVPWAISYASFPRLASLGEEAAGALSVRTVRIGLAGGILTAVALAAIVPVAIPLAFGDTFTPAVAPTIIAVVGGVVTSAQLLICRATAARARPQPLLFSFGLSLVVMLALDAVLIPTLGIVGAATAATVGPITGLTATILRYRRRGTEAIAFGRFVPTAADFRELIGFVPAALRTRLGSD